MQKYRQLNFKCYEEDDNLIEFVEKKEKRKGQTNAIRVALASYKENFELLASMKQLIKQQQEIIELLKNGRGL